MFMLLTEQAIVAGGPHGPYGQPGARGHHVGDSWILFSMLLASVVQPSAFLSCIRVTFQVTDE